MKKSQLMVLVLVAISVSSLLGASAMAKPDLGICDNCGCPDCDGIYDPLCMSPHSTNWRACGVGWCLGDHLGSTRGKRGHPHPE